jgi:chitin disaccharide deacetylase
MLIITADDYGKTRHATDSIFECFSHKRITSASAMVFMEDSKRAASLPLKTKPEVGLHLNFTMPFSSSNIPLKLREHLNRVVSYLAKHKFTQVVYNPFLADSFAFLFLAQQGEFVRLYGRMPEFYNGHHHMHLCANLLAAGLIPRGAKVRGTFTFERGEKNLFNLLYRRMLEIHVSKKFVSTDSFFSIAPVQNQDRVRQIINRAGREAVELEVHPENLEEMEFLLSPEFGALLDSVQIGRFMDLT